MGTYALGAILLQEGLITESQLNNALETQRQQVQTVGWQLLGEILVESKLITKRELKAVLARQASLYDLEFFSVLRHPSLHSQFKRGMDILGAIAGLFILLILLPLIAPVIYLSSPGPIFVGQPRVGLRGKHFLLWRFRTASPNAERQRLKLSYQKGNKLFDQASEPLLTPIGKLFKQLYLDEIPQFYNILKGEMSLVGTRPPTLDEVQFYTRGDWQRLAVKPGLTGLWQTNQRKYEMDFEEVLEVDFAYIDGWSRRLDLMILTSTIFHVLFSSKRNRRRLFHSRGFNNQIKILNVPFDNLSVVQFLETLKAGVVFTPNVDHLMKLQHDAEFLKIYLNADYRVCDSQILMYASRFLGTPLKEKISGSDFFPLFCRFHRNNEDMTVFLLGGAKGVADRARVRINAKIGRDMVVGAYSPSFGFEKNEQECLEIIEMINQSKATVLAVGVGAPKQEKWIDKYKDRFTHVKIFFAVGATIDFEAGILKRAPHWMSKMGLEWLFRIYSDPKRLWKRYLIEDLPFFWLLLKQKLGLYKPPSFASLKNSSLDEL